MRKCKHTCRGYDSSHMLVTGRWRTKQRWRTALSSALGVKGVRPGRSVSLPSPSLCEWLALKFLCLKITSARNWRIYLAMYVISESLRDLSCSWHRTVRSLGIRRYSLLCVAVHAPLMTGNKRWLDGRRNYASAYIYIFLTDTYMPVGVVVSGRFCITVWSPHFIKWHEI